VGVLNNDAQLETSGSDNGVETFRVVGDPTEGASWWRCQSRHAAARTLNRLSARRKIPFDSDRKRMVTIHPRAATRDEDSSPISTTKSVRWYAVAVKGAPDVVLELCSRMRRLDDRWCPGRPAARGDPGGQRCHDPGALRVLGVAYR
jgi:P-type Ca2+ transporter type 2C